MSNYEFKLTYVVLVDTCDALLSVNKQFKDGILSNKEIQCIVVNRSDMTDCDTAAVAKYMRKNKFEYVCMPADSTIAQCYNSAFDKIKGEYVCFTNQYVVYNHLATMVLSKAVKDYSDTNFITINYRKQQPERKIRPRRYNFSMIKTDVGEAQKLLTFLPSVFVRTAFIGDTRFNDVCQEESATFFLASLWAKDSTSVIFDKIFCEYDSSYINLKSDAYYGRSNKDFYINSLRDNFLVLINSYVDNGKQVPRWLQRLAYYRLYFKYYSNFNFRNQFLINDDELDTFFELSKQVLQCVPDDMILNNEQYEQFAPPLSIRNLFLYLKYDGDANKLDRSFTIEDDNLYFNECGCKYNLNAHKKLTIKAFNLRHGNLSIDLKYYTYMLYEYANDVFSVELNGKQYPILKNDIYSHDKVFGVSIEKAYSFYVDLPLSEVLKPSSTIAFYIKLNGISKRMELEFNRPPSKLNTFAPHSYWRISDEYTMVYEDDALVIKAFSAEELKEREKLFVSEIPNAIKAITVNMSTLKSNIKNAKALRKAYFKRKSEFDGRHIWLYFDKLYKAGDNGEYAFRHAMSRDDGIECYYIINEDSLDYPRLKAEFPNNILLYNTFECQLYALMAENIVATHPDIIEFCSINIKLASAIKDLFNANLICIAHGITIQKNADYQHRLYDNTMFYTTSSKYEVNHILNPIYGYREDEVALTGLARFDGLKNNDQKQVLITPTWRRNIVGKSSRNTTREYSDQFKQTSYYKIYNSLINDKRIIDVAKKTGYKLIFLLHPAMSAQIDDYDRNDYVELIQASGDLNYEKILTESSLMITDYSGIHYDFGYMRKPIIYYQPKEVPMRFEEGGMKFATMGFGPVCTEYEDAVSLICEYMSNECKMPDEYKKRADDFFAFDDFDSSKRIYDVILKWTNERKNYEVK